MTNKTYANFNQFTVDGRIFNAEIVQNNGNEWLSVTVITNPVDDSDGYTVTFNSSNGLMNLYRSGWLMNGRQVTVTGHISKISEIYEKDGELIVRKRPNIHLVDAQIPTGGLGPCPADKTETKPAAGRKVVRPSDAAKATPVADPAPAVADFAGKEAPLF